VCRAYQLSHSQFLAWSQDDRDKAIWELIRSAETCPGCGTRAAEWRPELGGHPAAHLPKLELCHGCEQLENMRATLAHRDPAEVRGVHVRLVRNQEVRRAR